MIKPLRWLLWSVGLGALALGSSWLITMPAKDIRGIWITEGYGLHLNIGRAVIDIYEVTDISCHRAQRIPAHTWLIGATQDNTLTREGAQLLINAGGTLGPIIANQSDALPATCPQTPVQSDNAQSNFDVLWQAMAERYPYFDYHGIDWVARRSDLRPTENAVLDDTALFNLFKATLTGLDDGNISLRTDDGRVYSPAIRPEWFADRHMVRDNTLGQFDDLQTVANTGLIYGWAAPGIGYAYVAHMDSKGGFNVKGTDQARNGFAEIALAFATADGVILDLRYTPGGSDAVALEYARYFTDATRLAFTKANWTGTGYTAPYPFTLEPQGNHHINRPVVVLTSGFTAGAAEVFAMSVRDLPQVTVMGTATSGALSDAVSFTLPNGWLLGLPHQRYTAPDGTSFALSGITPDQIVPVDIAAAREGRDTTLQQAIVALSNQ